MIRIRVTHVDRSVEAEGDTIAAAVRRAVGRKWLDLGPGRTIARTETTPGVWTWDWSGRALTVEVLAGKEKRTSGPSGPVKPRAERLSPGEEYVEARLTRDRLVRLDRLAALDGSRAEALRRAIDSRFAQVFGAPEKSTDP